MKIRSIKLQLLGENPPQQNFEFHLEYPISVKFSKKGLKVIIEKHMLALEKDFETLEISMEE